MFVVGAVIIAAATNVDGIYVGRFIVGIASALSAIADLPYLTEVAAPVFRGRLTSAYEMLVVMGILFSFIMNLMLVEIDGGWRWMFGLPAIFAGVQSMLMLSLPESPKWLLEKGRIEEARTVLRMGIDNDDDVNAILEEFRTQIDASLIELNASDRASSDESSAIMKNSDGRSNSEDRPLSMSKASKTFLEYKISFICILILMFFQQFTGGVVVRNYAAEIFVDAGFSEHNALVFTIVLGVVKVVITAWTIHEVFATDLGIFDTYSEIMLSIFRLTLSAGNLCCFGVFF